ncbi:DUF4272 domain-containing protein [Campylobacter concisus]|uniref:DUF4272 domain-containing protein n=1 Tax=Campylobacter concisus TaxID=199 RepID=UPI001CB7E526|nr:DUF4272 domain-containing protein [Campylobacter concisus]
MGVFDIFKRGVDMPKTAQQRKDESIKILKKEGVAVLESLPLRYENDEVTPRDIDEIIKRAVCSFTAIMCACTIRDEGSLGEENMAWAKSFLRDAYEGLSVKEKEVVEDRADIDTAVNMGWKYESLWILLWALGIAEDIGQMDKICDCEFVMNVFREGGLKSRSKLRSMDEILSKLDLVYRYHWACVNARVNGTKAAGLDEEVVMERRAGLEWLCCKGQENDDLSAEFNCWDYPDLNT